VENAAIDSLRGTGLDTGSSPTTNTDTNATTRPNPAYGVAGSVIRSDTQVRSLPLSADDERRLDKIRREYRQGWMQAFGDVGFLLEILERLL